MRAALREGIRPAGADNVTGVGVRTRQSAAAALEIMGRTGVVMLACVPRVASGGRGGSALRRWQGAGRCAVGTPRGSQPPLLTWTMRRMILEA
jgi:hypothetical protein